MDKVTEIYLKQRAEYRRTGVGQSMRRKSRQWCNICVLDDDIVASLLRLSLETDRVCIYYNNHVNSKLRKWLNGGTRMTFGES